MQKTSKKDVNHILKRISNNKRKIKFRGKFKISGHISNLNLKENNSIDTLLNKKESNNIIPTKSKNYGYSTEKTDYSSKFSDKNSSKIKISTDSKRIFLDIQVNKTIPSTYRNKKIFELTCQRKQIPNLTLNNYCPIKTFSNNNINKENFKNINNIEFEKIITFTNNLFYSKTPQKYRKTKDNLLKIENKRTKKNKFNSLNCFIDDYMSKDNNEIKKYKINYRDYFGDSDFEKLEEKEKHYLTEINKIKLIYKNTNLMKALCDYLNLSFGKLKNEKNDILKTINQEKEEIKKENKYLKFLRNNWKHNLIPMNNIYRDNHKFNLKRTFNNKNLYPLRKDYFSNKNVF